MQIVQVKLQDGVFVPLEPIEMTDSQEAIVVLAEKQQHVVSDTARFKDEARDYFMMNFPELGIESSVLDLVGIAPLARGIVDQAEYSNYLDKKYHD